MLAVIGATRPHYLANSQTTKVSEQRGRRDMFFFIYVLILHLFGWSCGRVYIMISGARDKSRFTCCSEEIALDCDY